MDRYYFVALPKPAPIRPMSLPNESGPVLDATSPLPPDIEAADEPTRVPLAIEDWATVIIMGLLACITFANVLVRYFTDSSFAWTEEFSVFLMILLALVAGSAAVARDRHIRIEYFAESGSMARRKRLAQFGAAMVALLFLLIAVLSVRVVWDDYRYEETSPGIGVPQWWYSIWLPVVSLAIALRALGLFVRRGRKTNYGSTDR
jgi:TRAP-type C4-dicarboxylate transport system permease small subunit